MLEAPLTLEPLSYHNMSEEKPKIESVTSAQSATGKSSTAKPPNAAAKPNAPLPVIAFRVIVVLVVAVSIALFQRSAYSIGGSKDTSSDAKLDVAKDFTDLHTVVYTDSDVLSKMWAERLSTLIEQAVQAGRERRFEIQPSTKWYFRVAQSDLTAGDDRDISVLQKRALELAKDERGGIMWPRATCMFFSDSRGQYLSFAWGSSEDQVDFLSCLNVAEDKKVCLDYDGGKVCHNFVPDQR